MKKTADGDPSAVVSIALYARIIRTDLGGLESGQGRFYWRESRAYARSLSSALRLPLRSPGNSIDSHVPAGTSFQALP